MTGEQKPLRFLIVDDDEYWRDAYVQDVREVYPDAETVVASDIIGAMDYSGKVDVLMIPVGGNFTIDAGEATQVIAQLGPKVVVPMHFKTPRCNLPIAPVDGFLEGKEGVDQRNASTMSVDADSLPNQAAIVVLEPAL